MLPYKIVKVAILVCQNSNFIETSTTINNSKLDEKTRNNFSLLHLGTLFK